MGRQAALNSPFLLGFDPIERDVRPPSEGYPPYNIERVAKTDAEPERLRLTLAVAGFSREALEITVEEGRLVVRGRQTDDRERTYLHRGIAARQFQRVFLLAEGMQIAGADLVNGLLTVDIVRPEPDRAVRRITITARD